MPENKLQMFQYSLLWHPNENETEEGKQSRILIDNISILAENKDDASVKAMAQIPEGLKVGHIELIIK